jgi:hypothetical protein
LFLQGSTGVDRALPVQDGCPGGSGAPPAQLWGIRIQDYGSGGDGVPTGVTQDQTVAGLHRK